MDKFEIYAKHAIKGKVKLAERNNLRDAKAYADEVYTNVIIPMKKVKMCGFVCITVECGNLYLQYGGI